jgi:hypothetical protein
MRKAEHETFGLQELQRFPDRSYRDAKFLGDIRLLELFAALVDARDYALTQDFCDVILFRLKCHIVTLFGRYAEREMGSLAKFSEPDRIFLLLFHITHRNMTGLAIHGDH